MGLALLISLLGAPSNIGGDSVIEKAQEDGLLIPTQESLSIPASPLEETEKKN